MTQGPTVPTKDERFTVDATTAQQTLAAVLRARRPGTSWSTARNWVEGRRVQVSGNLCLDPARRLTLGEEIVLSDRPAPKAPKDHDVRIHFIDAHVIVIEKPSGIPTIRRGEEKSWPQRRKDILPALEEIVPRLIPPSQRAGRLIVCHRLDRGTSGLLVFARTTEAQQHLDQQFRKHTIIRRYQALIHGQVEAQTIVSRLVTDRGDGKRGSTTLPDIGKEAITHVRPIETIGAHQLIECQLETGRTHQIRIHLCEFGHPLAGDTRYRGPAFQPPIEDDSGLQRLALHAGELGFIHPATGQTMHFLMPMPPDLQRAIDRLRWPGNR